MVDIGIKAYPLFFLISRINIACCPHEFNLQISWQIGIMDNFRMVDIRINTWSSLFDNLEIMFDSRLNI